MYIADTEGICVRVEPHFIAKESNSGVDYFIYSYTISIKNNGHRPCQLMSRHWIIRDGQGREEHVIGEGVVGKQPMIRPGEVYTYRSGCPLGTPTGNMRGTYQMLGPDNQRFEIRIPLFFLRPDCPRYSAASAALN
jgi:ApaG protein